MGFINVNDASCQADKPPTNGLLTAFRDNAADTRNRTINAGVIGSNSTSQHDPDGKHADLTSWALPLWASVNTAIATGPFSPVVGPAAALIEYSPLYVADTNNSASIVGSAFLRNLVFGGLLRLYHTPTSIQAYPNINAVVYEMGALLAGDWLSRREWANFTTLVRADTLAPILTATGYWVTTVGACTFGPADGALLGGATTYDTIPTAAIDADSSSGDASLGGQTLPQRMRANGLALKSILEAGHPLNQGLYAIHNNRRMTTQAAAGAALSFGVGWNPTGMAQVVNEAARAIPNGVETHDLWAPPALSETDGFVAIWFLQDDAMGATDAVCWRALRATPAMLRAVIQGEETGGGAPTGTYNVDVWQVPVQGQSDPVTSAFSSIADASIEAGNPLALLSDSLFDAYKNRDDAVYQLLTAEHDAAGVHKMGLAQMAATKLLDRQAITADPGGAAQQLFDCSWLTDGKAVFLEVFADGAGDTGLDLSFGWEFTDAAGATRPVLIADRVAGGAVASNYEVTVWQL